MTPRFCYASRRAVILVFALLALAAVSGDARGEDGGAHGLWPIKNNDGFGYIDRNGKVVIRPQFEEAAPFHENLAAVRIKGKWGFIETRGRTVVPPQFEAVEPFVEGVAKVKNAGKWGFVDSKGRLITPPQFDWAMSVREGLALVEQNGKHGFVGRDGQLVVAPRFAEAGEFWEGLARVQVGDLWGFIDKTGKMVIEPQYVYAGNFHEGLAQVDKDGKHGYIDRAGQLVIPLLFDGHRLEMFSEGLAMIVKGDKVGYIDRTGHIVIPSRYWLAWHFQEGVARVQMDDAKWGLINRTGEVVSEGRFDNISDFHEGLARVRIFRNYGFIAPSGALAIPVEFSAALPFSEGLAAVHVGGSHQQLAIEDPRRRFDPMSPLFLYSRLPFSGEKVPRMSGGKGWGYIDRRGRIVISPGFDFAGSFVGGLAEASQAGRHGYIDKSGKFLWESREAAEGGQKPGGN